MMVDSKVDFACAKLSRIHCSSCLLQFTQKPLQNYSVLLFLCHCLWLGSSGAHVWVTALPGAELAAKQKAKSDGAGQLIADDKYR